MRLAREYERAEGPDLRGFLAFAATQDLIEAREGEAALESDGLDAVRLMTIHRAKGLEFPVVCVADLGRAAGGNRERLLLGRDGSVGLKLSPIGGGEPVPALDWDRLAAREQEADAEEERRLFYVAMTRACERLILSGGARLRAAARAAARRPADRLDRARADRRPGRRRRGAGDRDRAAVGRPPREPAVPPQRPRRRSEPCCRARPCRRPPVHAPERPAPRCRTRPPSCPHPRPAPSRPRSACPTARSAPTPAAATASTSSACWGCRASPPPPDDRAAPTRSWRRRPGSTRAFAARSSTGCSRTSTSRGRSCPTREAVPALAAAWGVEITADEVEDVRSLVAAFAGSPLCERLAGRPPHAPRGAVRVRARPVRRRPARQRVPGRPRRRARRRPADRRLQVRPARGARRRRGRRARLRDPADRVRARRPARRARRARRSRTASWNAPASRSPAPSRRPTPPPSPNACTSSRAACSRGATRSPPPRTATCAPTAPAARRREVLVAPSERDTSRALGSDPSTAAPVVRSPSSADRAPS